MTGLWVLVALLALSGGLRCALCDDTEEYPLRSVRQCVDDGMKGRRFKKKTASSPLHLDFGDPALEIFNIVSAHDAMTIRTLEHCVRSIVPEMYEDRLSLPSRNYTHGGSNVTFVTGVLQVLLGEVLSKIVASTAGPMKEESVHFWLVPVESLGLRCAYIETFANVKPKLTKEERRAVRYQRFLEQKSKTVLLGGPDERRFVEDDEEDVEEEEYVFDEQADEHLAPYMRAAERGSSVYKAVVLLTDRAHFSGGEFFLSRDDPNAAAGAAGAGAGAGVNGAGGRGAGSGDGEGEGEGDGDGGGGGYEEEDEEEDAGEVYDERAHLHGFEPRRKKQTHPRYNARTARIARYTPEKGSVLLARADYSHGLGVLHRGRRTALVLEFWPFADGRAGDKRPGLGEARSLPGGAGAGLGEL